MRPSPRSVLGAICAFVVLEVTLGMIFPAAAWQYVKWVGGVGIVIVCVVLARLYRPR